jgi:hypothetical protein
MSKVRAVFAIFVILIIIIVGVLFWEGVLSIIPTSPGGGIATFAPTIMAKLINTTGFVLNKSNNSIAKYPSFGINEGVDVFTLRSGNTGTITYNITYAVCGGPGCLGSGSISINNSINTYMSLLGSSIKGIVTNISNQTAYGANLTGFFYSYQANYTDPFNGKILSASVRSGTLLPVGSEYPGPFVGNTVNVPL